MKRALELLTILFIAVPAQATVVFSDNFGTPAAGADASLAADAGSWTNTGTGYIQTGTVFAPVTDSANLLGHGADNGILHVQDQATTGNINGVTASFSQTLTSGIISFDFYQVIIDNSATGNTYFRLQLVSGSTEAFRLDIFCNGITAETPFALHGPSTTISQETLVHFDLCFNATGASTTVGGVTVASQTFQLFVNGAGIGAGPFSNAVTSASALKFATGSANVTNDYLDNLVVADVIPEPASVALLGIGILAGVMRRG